jgi:hypothetical protein
MCKLAVLRNGLSAFAVRQDVVDGAVVEQMDGVLAELATVRRIP